MLVNRVYLNVIWKVRNRCVLLKGGSWFDTFIITVIVRIVTVMVMLWMKVP